MEHILHMFGLGGSCGEHHVWAALVGFVGPALLFGRVYWAHIRRRWFDG